MLKTFSRQTRPLQPPTTPSLDAPKKAQVSLADLPANCLADILAPLAPQDMGAMALAGRAGRDFVQSPRVVQHFSEPLQPLATPKPAQMKQIRSALPREMSKAEKYAGAVGTGLGWVAIGGFAATLLGAVALAGEREAITAFVNKSKKTAQKLARRWVNGTGRERRAPKATPQAAGQRLNVTAHRASRLAEHIVAMGTGPRADVSRCAELLNTWPSAAPLSWYMADTDRAQVAKVLLSRARDVLRDAASPSSSQDWKKLMTAAETALTGGTEGAGAALEAQVADLQVEQLKHASLDQLTALLDLPEMAKRLHAKAWGLSRWQDGDALSGQAFASHPALVQSFQAHLARRLEALDGQAVLSHQALVRHLIDGCQQSGVEDQLRAAAEQSVASSNAIQLQLLHALHPSAADTLRRAFLRDLAGQNWTRASTLRRAGVPASSFRHDNKLRTAVYKALAEASERRGAALAQMETIVGIA